MGETTSGRLDGGTKVALVAMCLGIFLIANDFTALSVAIPDIESDLSTSLGHAQWVINAYALVFGVLIVTGGRLADLFGRKRAFMIGAAIFGIFSLLSGLAPSIELLITGRALMGVGGALMWPAILGMVYGLLPDDKAGLAGGLVLGVAGAGNAVGPLLGGVLTQEIGWEAVFFLNVPVAVFAMWITQAKVPESQLDTGERRIDYPGIAILSVAAVSVLVALDEGPTEGFGDPIILGLFGLAAVLLVGWVVVERRMGEAALVPSSVLRNRLFAACAATVLFMSAIFFSALLYLPQYFEKILGYTALEAGAGLLPMMGVFTIASFVAGHLYDRLGARIVAGAGAISLAGGMFLLALLDTDSSFWALVPGMAILGLGVGLFYSAITTTAVTSLDASKSSLAGGIVYMCQIAGGAVGLGINTAIVTSADSLIDGIQVAFVVDGVLAVFGFLLVLAVVPSRTTPVADAPVAAHASHHLIHHRHAGRAG
ncbi:MAG TPA: DHA2 family efflux MFS transporter permease subunit [Acidimicrobiia bacterium]|nr:DHA2 family efflux MFS transporter permease subunit [Acidimicrobiia bacterium]